MKNNANLLEPEREPISILLCEDDPNLGEFLRTYLNSKGYATVLYRDGEAALDGFREGGYNFVITDVMMPKKDGFTLAKDIRRIDAGVPILFLTAKTLEADRLKGFQIGGDDYMTKPFSMDELLLRIQAILRRTMRPIRRDEKKEFDFGCVRFDAVSRRLYRADGPEEVVLTTRESDLMQFFCLNFNQIIERRDALVYVWKSDNYFNARSMDVYVAKLRKALKQVGGLEIINVHGVGFKMVAAGSGGEGEQDR